MPAFATQKNIEDYLVGYWPANQGSGTLLIDSSKYNITGSMNNVQWAKDEFGNCLKLSVAANSSITFGTRITDALARAQGMTFSAWIKLPDGSDTSRNRFFGTFLGGVVGSEVYMFPSQKQLVIGLRSTLSDQWMSKSYNFAEFGKWIHLAVVASYREKFARVYVNGYELPPKDNTSYVGFGSKYYDSATSTGQDYIAGDGTTSMNGYMKEIRIYRTALSAEDVAGLASKWETETSEATVQASQKWAEDEPVNNFMPKVVLMHTDRTHYFKFNGISQVDHDNYSVAPFEEEGKVYIPIKAAAAALDYSYSFDERSKVIKMSNHENEINFLACSEQYNFNKSRSKLHDKTILRDGVCYFSLDTLSEMFNQKTFYKDGLIAFGEDEVLDQDLDDKLIKNVSRYFSNELYPKPYRNHMKTRTVVNYQDENTAVYIGSPSMVRLDKNTFVASHDFFGKAIGNSYLTLVHKSTDGGKTWKHVATLEDLYWGSMFEDGGNIYILGTTKPGGSIVIRKSSDQGLTWTTPTDSKSGLIVQGELSESAWFHAGSVPVAKAHGRIYKGFENGATPHTNWRHKYALVVSAPQGSDLLDASNWTKSNEILFDQSWQPKDWVTNDTIWIEGNVVVDRDGNLFNVMRLETKPLTDKAAILSLSPDGKTLTFDPETGFIDFPGGMSLFNIKYDPVTDCYISLVNNVTDKTIPTQRNVLSLSYSKDMRNWKIAETVLIDNFSGHSWAKSVDLIGFQYVDWMFDGDDILFLVREANGAFNYHNANYLTFYRLEDYKRYMDYENKE